MIETVAWPFPKLSERAILACLIGIVGINALVIYSALFNRPLLSYLLAEMGPVESIGTIFCALATILFAYAAITDARASGIGLRTFWLLSLAAAAFFLTMEEISWGQHLFGFKPPEAIGEISTQNELNVHNVKWLQDAVHLVGLSGLFAYFILVPLASANLCLVRCLVDWLQLPVPPLRLTLLYATSLFLFRAFLLAYRAHPELTPVNTGELQEAIYQFILFLFAFNVLPIVREVVRIKGDEGS
jgi:hypothetical protein